jgi:serine/threonine protein kinase/Flp pilus assembly protein TadD
VAVKCPSCHSDNPETVKFCGECGASLPPARNPTPKATETIRAPLKELTRGSLFARRYEVIEELGKGGMGKVYRVFDKKIEEEVVLKLIKPEVAADEETIKRFSNELKLARKIAHRNVCKMFDLGEADGAHFITMEYVPGEDLKKLIRMSGQLGVGTSISIAKQVCEGLAEAHRLGVVHRDLKPQNIMVDEEGQARIMDFGIARSLKAKGITGAGVMIGTPEYMSPEQVEAKEVDARSDIYSLGTIIYEMLTGRVPFEGDTPFTIGVKHKSEIPKNPKEINTQIPEDLSRLILKCLEKEKEKRYQRAEDVHSELTRIEQGIPTTERILPKRRAATAREATVTFRKRWVFLASILVVTLVAALAFFMIRGVRGKKEVLPQKNKMLVVLPFENLGSPEDEYFADGMTDEITNRLSSLYGLNVISRASAIQYKKTNKTIRQIKQELNVDYALTGTVRWDKSAGTKGRVRVSPQLIRAQDDTQVWSKTYEQSIEDIFAIQTGIGEEVVKQLDLTLLEPERKALIAKPTKNLEAYGCYLRAVDHWQKGQRSADVQENRLAIEMVEKAIKIDPSFVQAYMNLSLWYSTMFHTGTDRSQEQLEKAKAAADKALELEPNLPEAKEALAWYYYLGFKDYDRALEILESVQKARPNNPPLLLGTIQRRQGKWEESLATLEKIYKLNPRDSDLAFSIARNNEFLRRYKEAEAWFDRSLSLDPEGLATKIQKAYNSYLMKGITEEAIAILKTLPPSRFADYTWFMLEMADRNYKEALDRLGSPSFDTFEDQYIYFTKDLGYAAVFHALKDLSAMKSHADLARAALEKSVREHPDDPRYHSALGLAYAYLGRKEEAIREGNQAVSILPVSKEALVGPKYVFYLAQIEVIVGESESAIDKLDYLMSIPAGDIVSINSLRKDPAWDPLRDQPRFKQLIEKYSKNT